MKVVILLAGVSRRMGEATRNSHKALTLLDSHPLLYHLINNFMDVGLNDIIPILGHAEKKIDAYLSTNFPSTLQVHPVYNKHYNTRNNLYSLYCARSILQGEEFILCNGDLIFDPEILNSLNNYRNESAIAVDDLRKDEIIDSPSVLMKGERISDLGRHIAHAQNEGYAIGIYKFSSQLSAALFEVAENMLDTNPDAGFHDPLPELFQNEVVRKCSIGENLWTDIDTPEDVELARQIHSRIMARYDRQ